MFSGFQTDRKLEQNLSKKVTNTVEQSKKYIAWEK